MNEVAAILDLLDTGVAMSFAVMAIWQMGKAMNAQREYSNQMMDKMLVTITELCKERCGKKGD